MNKTQAFKAGLLGGIAMTLVMALLRTIGLMEANHEMMLGTMMGLLPSTGAWILGFLIHLTLSGCIALVYAAAFEFWLFRAGWQPALALGVFHSLFAGLFSRLLPAFHHSIPEAMPEPGPMWSNFGTDDIVSFIALRLMYAAIVGGVYNVKRGSKDSAAVVRT